MSYGVILHHNTDFRLPLRASEIMQAIFDMFVPGINPFTQGKNRSRLPNERFRIPVSSAEITLLRCLAWLLFSSGASFAQQDDPELRERFLQGIAGSGEKIQLLSFRATCVTVSGFTSVNAQTASAFAKRNLDPLEKRTWTYQCAIRGLNTLKTGTSKSGNTYFNVRNDAYAFALERTLKEQRTSLQFVEQLGVDPTIDAKVLSIEENVRGTVLATYYLWALPLTRLLNDGNPFKITRVYPIDSEGVERVRVEFEGATFYVPPGQSSSVPEFTYSKAFLVCDPADAWALTEYGSNIHHHPSNDDSVNHVTVQAGNSVHGIPLAKSIQRKSSFPAQPENIDLSASTIETTDEEVPQAEFLLTHYGLSEPNFQKSSFPSWASYLIGGVICLAIGGIVLKRGNLRIKMP